MTEQTPKTVPTAMYRPWDYRDLPDADLKRMMQQLAQELAHRHAERQCPVRLEFPRGCIRTIGELRERWPYVSWDTRRTLACYVQLCDVNRWSLNTWELKLTAGTMWVWQCCLPVVAIIETVLLEYGLRHGWLAPDARFKKVINTMQSKGVYGTDLRDDLHKLRDYRNNIHIYLAGHVEMHDGMPARYNEAVRTLQVVEAALMKHWKDSQPDPLF